MTLKQLEALIIQDLINRMNSIAGVEASITNGNIDIQILDEDKVQSNPEFFTVYEALEIRVNNLTPLPTLQS